MVNYSEIMDELVSVTNELHDLRNYRLTRSELTDILCDLKQDTQGAYNSLRNQIDYFEKDLKGGKLRDGYYDYMDREDMYHVPADIENDIKYALNKFDKLNSMLRMNLRFLMEYRKYLNVVDKLVKETGDLKYKKYACLNFENIDELIENLEEMEENEQCYE